MSYSFLDQKLFFLDFDAVFALDFEGFVSFIGFIGSTSDVSRTGI